MRSPLDSNSLSDYGFRFIHMFYSIYRYVDEVFKCDANIYYAENYLQSGEDEG